VVTARRPVAAAASRDDALLIFIRRVCEYLLLAVTYSSHAKAHWFWLFFPSPAKILLHQSLRNM
jgi:hypothetical protein